jgi:hypothetical protein
VAGYQELLEALKQASESVEGTADPLAAGRLERQKTALAKLQACMAGGIPELTEEQAGEVAVHLRALLVSNSLNLKWTRLRAQLARIGVPRKARPAPSAPRLDLVS